MAYYVKGEELVCEICGEVVDTDEANICPDCEQVFCKNCCEESGTLWCTECNTELDDFENYIEFIEEDE